ncbi:MAG: ROK family glucokinase [Oscillospiraceae bacterium]|nr:ROK family glucokinase [Oscillospiraceae bacterium]MBQ4538216.1 ROK family glucokinase [Oscillospiraceae bacterium]
MSQFVFGVDIGGTTVKLGLFTSDGTLLEKWEIPTVTENSGAAILPDVAASINAKIKEKSLSFEQIAGIGLGVPGPVGPDSTVYKCINLGWGVFNLKEEMNRLIPEIPNVAAANDANVAALGELWQGGGKGKNSAVMFTLGTGVGGGVIINGKIVAGANGGGGEVGHIVVEPNETEACNCGKCGCLEQYASANGIVKMAKNMLSKCDTPSALRDMEHFTSKEICDLAREGEKMAGIIIDHCCEYLGRAMSFVACTVDPDVFIIGGGMSRAGCIISDTTFDYYHKYAFHVSNNTTIATAELGNDAGIYGCAKMVLG